MEEVQGFAISLSNMIESEFDEMFALLRYSLESWLLHAKEVENADMSQDDLAALDSEYTNDMLHSRVARYERLKAWVDKDRFFETTFLHIASKHNLISVVNATSARNYWADQTDRWSRTSLSVAAEEGHKAPVELPVNRDAVDANSTDCCRATPLFWAAARRARSYGRVADGSKQRRREPDGPRR